MAIFAPDERLPSSATLITWNVFSIKMTLICYGRASWLDLLLDKCSNCTIIVASTGLANCCLWTQIHSLALEHCIRTHKTRFQLILPLHSHNVTKNLTGHRMHVAFRICVTCYRQKLTVWLGKSILCKKTPPNRLFWWTRIWVTWLWKALDAKTADARSGVG